MLTDEISIEEIIAVRREEALEEGREDERNIIAKNLLAEGSTPEFVQKITGLDLETIQKIINDA